MNKTRQFTSAQLSGLKDLPVNENEFISFLRDPNERSIIPSTNDKVEFKIWSEDSSVPDEQYRTLYEFLDKPVFKPVDNISNAELPGALKSLLGVMNKNGMFLKTFTDVPDRELYRFVTKDLFRALTTDKKWIVPVTFIYEEFHGNEEYLIKKAASDFLRALFGLEMWEYQWKLWKNVLHNYAAIKQFILSYEGFDVRSIEFDELSRDGNEASVLFEADFYAICHNNVFVHHYEGDGWIGLLKNNDSWRTRNVTIPNRVG